MSKKIWAFFIVSVVLAGLIAPAAAQENDPVTIRFSWWGNPTRDERTIQVIELFEETYPWITVEYDTQGWNDYWIVMDSQGQGGNLPDVMQQDYSRLKTWVDAGWLLSLDDLASDGIIDLSNVADASINSGKIDDELYAIALGTNSLGIMLDLEVYEDAGIPLPASDWTWEDFEDVCLTVHEQTDSWCIGANLELDVVWESLWLGYGETAYAADGKSFGYSSNQPYIDYLHMLLRLQEAGAIPNIADIRVSTETTQAITQGEAAGALLWSNQMIGAWAESGEDRQFTMVHLPRPADGCCASNYVKPSMFLSISANSEHPEEAAMLVDFFTNSLEANRILLAERGVPISSEVQADLRDYISPAQVAMFEFLARVEEDNSPLPPPNPAAHGVIFDNAFNPLMIDPVLFGEISPEQGVALFEEEAVRLLTEE